MNRINYSAIALVLLFASAISVATPLASRSFGSGSLTEILSDWEKKPLMLVLWSADCPPCIHELDVLAELSKKHPALNLVMVSTDGVALKDDVEKILQSHGLGNVESWIFSEANAHRLRYEIDRTWYGELPRTYFFDSDHNRSAVSGKLTSQQVEAWLSSVSLAANTAEPETSL